MIIEKRVGGAHQRWNIRKYMDVYVAKRRQGLVFPAMHKMIPNHIMVGQRLEYKGKIYTVVNVAKNWYAGYYLSLVLEDENGSGPCLPYNNINSISETVLNSMDEVWEHIDFIGVKND